MEKGAYVEERSSNSSEQNNNNNRRMGVGQKATTLYRGKEVVLLPQPSDDPQDPLNWPIRRKHLTLLVVCVSAFAAGLVPTCHQLAYIAMESTFPNEPVINLEYTLTAGIAGLFVGPLAFIPFIKIIGRSSLIFLMLIGCIVTQIWSATSTSQTDFASLIVARVLAGCFASVPVVIGSGYIMDIYFLHQRGVAFAFYEISALSPYYVGPTLGGYIVQGASWPVVFWWTIAPLGLAAILVFCFLHSTGYNRHDSHKRQWPDMPTSFLKNRMVTYFPGHKTLPEVSLKDAAKSFITPYVIVLNPAIMIIGLFTCLIFGFNVGLVTLLSIFLQTPVSEGGYAFSPARNASFTFTSWVGFACAYVLGSLVGDRVPIWFARRFGKGIWHPEYRLVNILFPAIAVPVGLGLFGAGVQYHLHYMVLAVGLFLVNFASIFSVPVCLNYAIECFTSVPIETAVAMNMYRLAFGIAIAFFIEPWMKAVGGAGWVFGSGAFFCVFVSLLVLILAWQGTRLRKIVLMKGIATTEDKERVIDSDSLRAANSEEHVGA